MLFENVVVGNTVCDPNENHQRVINKFKKTKLVQLEDEVWYFADELDVADHPYKHLARV